MYLTVRGLVLRVTDYNDRDSLITLLTQDRGRLCLKARGLRRKNSPLNAPCQLLAYGEFTLFEYKDAYTINEAHALELFLGLRKDIERLSLATYFAQVAEVISQEDLPNPRLLSLTLNVLYALAKLEIPQLQIKAAFELRCACIAGYAPDLFSCRICGNPNANKFDVSAGCLECTQCRGTETSGLRMPVSPGVLQAMRYIVSCDMQNLLSFRLSTEGIRTLSQVTEAYLSTQLERGFSTLDFYKSLFIS